MGRRKTTEEFISDAKMVHGDKYDYSLVDYRGNKINVNIICKKHGIFNQLPNNHISRKSICPKCDNEIKSINFRKPKNNFIIDAKKIHGEKYDYSLVDYKNNKIMIRIICKKHGIFIIRPNDHLNGKGCKKCSHILLSKKFSKGKETFIKESKKVHENKYDYSLVDYINNKTKVKIICPKHGEFLQNPHHHIIGNGCPVCNSSKGENKIIKYLKNKDIKYISQKTFKNCKYKSLLYFDFYLPDYNICIEYDGEQHYKYNNFFGGENEFIKLKIRDKIKNKYCKDNNINLLRIKYDENINEKLNSYLEKIT